MKIITTNKKAYFQFDVLETFVAGIKLEGREIKSLRNSPPHFSGSFVSILNGKPYLVDLNIARYKYDGSGDYNPKRKRVLLLKKSEIDRLQGKLSEKGLTVVPLEIGFERQWAKVKIGVVRGKKLHDKRRVIREREDERSVRRIIKRRS
jgi:SsrA-binding protein